MIHVGDCVTVMAGMPADSVDAIVTDPPYGLEFMGKGWDKFGAHGFTDGADRRDGPSWHSGDWANKRCVKCGHIASGGSPCRCPDPEWVIERGVSTAKVRAFQAWCTEWGREALRVTKPGGYLLAFGGTRTHHRLVCGLEDAGWIIRDELTWVYASGFPKGRANLKPAHEPIVLARKPGPLRPLNIEETRIGASGGGNVCPGGDDCECVTDGRAYSPTKHPVRREGEFGRWPSNLLLSDPELFDSPNPWVVGSGATARSAGNYPVHEGWTGEGYGGRFSQGPLYEDSGGYSRFFIIPKADRADREPVLRDAAIRLHRESGACDKLGPWESADRSPSEQTDSTSRDAGISASKPGAGSSSATSSPGKPSTARSPRATKSTTSTATSRTTGSTTSSSLTPSLTNESTPGASSETVNGGSPAQSAESSSPLWPSTGTSPEKAGPSTAAAARATSGSLSKQRRCADCGKPLPRVGTHPTTKPTDLMRHLIRLVTPIGGVILDPFAGSGSTGVAATLEGFDFILIEQSAEYVAIAEARLNGTQRGLGLDVGAPTRKQPTIGMHSLPPEKRAGHAVEGWGFTGQTDDDTPDPETGMSENDLRWPFGHAVQPDEEPAA